MISIRKTAMEQERAENLKNAALECYQLAISSSEQNVIEVDHKEAAAFQAELRALLGRLGEATTAEQLLKIQSLFGAELHDYRDATHEQLRRLRRNFEAAARALEEFAGTTVSRGDDQEQELRQTLGRLEATLECDRIEDIRAAVRAGAASILTSFEHMRALNHLSIAQLKDEIRLLHQRSPLGRPSAGQNPLARTWSRRDIDDRIEELLKRDMSFCLVLAVLRNLKPLVSRNSNAVMEDALQSLQVRLHTMFKDASVVGRWTTNQFVAILNVAPGSSIAMSREVAQKLMEPYDFVEDGVRRSLSFQVAAGIVDHRTGSDVPKFRTGLDRLSSALGGVD
jgi:GGDEF domain-containing protein